MNPVRILIGVWIFICEIAALISTETLGDRRGNRLPASSVAKVEWTVLSECSRTCGGGVAFSDRICSKFSVSQCEPERKYFLCNTRDCPHGSKDFRDLQCQQYDGMEFEGVLYNWISYYGAENQCALNCLAKGTRFYRRLAEKVVDGTPCERNTLNVCIDGRCQSVGCDRVLGSKRVFDACLICGGYGATCKTLQGTIETQDMESGYNHLILLPKGATSITIREESSSRNYFAVRNIDGVYYLNGNFEFGVAEPRQLGLTFFEYRRLYRGMEYLSAVGPLQEPLIIEIIKQPGITPAVKYDYSVLYNVSSDQMYAWIAQAWSQCNASCGIGYLNRVVSCIKLVTKRPVEDDFCRDLQKPSSDQLCQRISCTARWYFGAWHDCSVTCGNSGIQTRQVFCRKSYPDVHAAVVSEDQCPRPKPETIQNCNRNVSCAVWNAKWAVGNWTQCSVTCGGGQRRRELFCFIGNRSVDLQNCDERTKPYDHQNCNQMTCNEDVSVSISPRKSVTSTISVTDRLSQDSQLAVDCHNSIHGCCSDGKTPAAGPDQHGCSSERGSYKDSCEFTSYGCCPDGVTSALGPNDAHCPHLLHKAVICNLTKDPGPCSDYSLKWSFDSTFGDCLSFEYGGCAGNENRFKTKDACRQACVSPKGIERCYLPRSSGHCSHSLIRYYYNTRTRRCEEFIYGGCLGNKNRFSTESDCEKSCIEPQKPDVCNQPPQRGRCRASITHYYFDPKDGLCHQFVYGGCGGNNNRFESSSACEVRCGESLIQNCRLPRDPGPCNGQFYQWYFNSETGQCQEFNYGGCLGNANRFRTKMDCEKDCKRLLRNADIDRCSLSPATGSCNGSFQNWYYDQSDGYCKEFLYGGCGGNQNRFESESDCREDCDANHPIDVCTLPADAGRCGASVERFYFDGEVNQCLGFVYGGCDGNGNNFQSLEECRKKCSSHINLTLPPGSNRCLLPRDPGPCIESMLRWHYSPLDRRCVKFEYGGCGGNHNRFLSESVCNIHCGHLALMTSPTTPPTILPHVLTTPTTKLPHVLDTIMSTIQHHFHSTAPHDYDPVMSINPNTVKVPDFDWYNIEFIPMYKNKLEAPLQPTKEVRPEDDVLLSTQPDLDAKLWENPESPLDQRVSGTPMSGESVTVSTGSIGETAYGRSFDVSKQERKKEDPSDYGKKDFHGTKEGNSGETTGSPPSATDDDGLISHESPTNDKDVCRMHKDSGPCERYRVVWYFEPIERLCRRFYYGGCEGNDNRFNSSEECYSQCFNFELGVNISITPEEISIIRSTTTSATPVTSVEHSSLPSAVTTIPHFKTSTALTLDQLSFAQKQPEKCVDKSSNCEMIVGAKLCHHSYFSVSCCSTCHKAGHLP